MLIDHMGLLVRVIDDSGADLESNQMGNITVNIPMPPACLPTLFNNYANFP